MCKSAVMCTYTRVVQSERSYKLRQKLGLPNSPPPLKGQVLQPLYSLHPLLPVHMWPKPHASPWQPDQTNQKRIPVIHQLYYSYYHIDTYPCWYVHGDQLQHPPHEPEMDTALKKKRKCLYFFFLHSCYFGVMPLMFNFLIISSTPVQNTLLTGSLNIQTRLKLPFWWWIMLGMFTFLMIKYQHFKDSATR